MEVYKAVFDGVLRIQPVDAEEDSALIGNLRDGVKDDLVVMVSGEEDAAQFAVVAETNLVFAETTAHFSRIVSEVRYGVDIFEDKTGC